MYGIDYYETFSLVAKISFVRVLIYQATNLNWPLFQLDVENVFLHGESHGEVVYMKQSLGFVTQGEYQSCVCKLKKKNIIWSQTIIEGMVGKFSKVILEFGPQRYQTDHVVFHSHNRAGDILLVVNVDNIVITFRMH